MTALVLGRPFPASPGLLVPAARVLAELTRDLAPVAVRRLPLGEAEGGVLAAALVAPSPVPPRAVALRRGYAVAAADTTGAGPYSPLPLASVPTLVGPGDVLPSGADAVLPEDAVSIAAGLVEVQESVAPGFWARRRGEDAAAGTVLREAGLALRPVDVAVAGAAGLQEALIRRPKVLVAGRGDAAGLVAALAREAGAEVRLAPKIGPGESAGYDLAIVIEAVEEQAKALPEAGGRLVAARLALWPGEDGAALVEGTCPVLLAQPRLADALGVFLGLGLPVLRQLAGAKPGLVERGPLARKVASSVGIAELVLLRRAPGGLEPLATGDPPLAAIAAAEAWLIVPPESEGFAAGETIEAERFRP
ncbi:hypothetical protein [Enterovirga aerilata]|uniref:Molybdopterin molybdenumtransferase n=1 Tax=Enterovirga aerilata TaxID=2730920 RepID=A0A849IEB7_9HYPH|nr:hypothetical protein [Enterovirga sp. DB1703]NNM72223.1 hypothetical protein [Enterovirga sp. DB1703]